MNKQNIKDLINLLETIDEADFNLSEYAHPCGSPACVAGHATTLDSWQVEGGLLAEDGRGVRYSPSFKGYLGAPAFSKWAEIDIYDARVICGMGSWASLDQLYGNALVRNVTAKQAAAGLNRYLNGEEIIK
jgi:hypothetical protein